MAVPASNKRENREAKMVSSNVGVNIKFQAYCPDRKRTVGAFLLPGSLERLQMNESDVEVGHYTSNMHIGAHKWMLVNPHDRDDLHKRLAARLFGL